MPDLPAHFVVAEPSFWGLVFLTTYHSSVLLDGCTVVAYDDQSSSSNLTMYVRTISVTWF